MVGAKHLIRLDRGERHATACSSCPPRLAVVARCRSRRRVSQYDWLATCKREHALKWISIEHVGYLNTEVSSIYS